MLFATLLALGAAVLHAIWNFVAKRADGDRYIVLTSQFIVAGGIAALALAATAGRWNLPAGAWGWAMVSGTIHLPYTWLLARAYNVGDFSVAYPLARGGGAALAAIGGVVLLGDHLSLGNTTGLVIVISGLTILTLGARGPAVAIALMVAVTIGAYTLVDAHASRITGNFSYVFVSHIATATTTSLFLVSQRRLPEVASYLRVHAGRAVATALASLSTYGMVLVAVRYAPVGYVAALRESSVVLAALAGWRFLGEGDHRRRILAAAVVALGLVVLVATR